MVVTGRPAGTISYKGESRRWKSRPAGVHMFTLRAGYEVRLQEADVSAVQPFGRSSVRLATPGRSGPGIPEGSGGELDFRRQGDTVFQKLLLQKDPAAGLRSSRSWEGGDLLPGLHVVESHSRCPPTKKRVGGKSRTISLRLRARRGPWGRRRTRCPQRRSRKACSAHWRCAA